MSEQHKTPPSSLQSSAGKPPDLKKSGSESGAHAPVHSEAIVGEGDVSQFADVDWERSLQGRLEDLVHYGSTFLPYEELYSLVIQKASPEAWPTHELPRYLSNRLVLGLISRYPDSILLGSGHLYLGYADEFSIQICNALENCYNDSRPPNQHEERDKREEMLWVHAPRQMEPSGIRLLPRSITDPIEGMLEMLRKYLRPKRRHIFEQDAFERDQFEEDTRLWVANSPDLRQPERDSEGAANAERTISLGALTKAWREEGYHEHLLRRYVWYRMIKQAPSRQYEVECFVSQLFDKPWEARRWNSTDDRNDDADLRIHYAR
jgi:hypothetical protein